MARTWPFFWLFVIFRDAKMAAMQCESDMPTCSSVLCVDYLRRFCVCVVLWAATLSEPVITSAAQPSPESYITRSAARLGQTAKRRERVRRESPEELSAASPHPETTHLQPRKRSSSRAALFGRRLRGWRVAAFPGQLYVPSDYELLFPPANPWTLVIICVSERFGSHP